MIGYADLLFNVGLADIHEREVILGYESEITKALQRGMRCRCALGGDNLGDNVAAFRAFDEMLNGDFFPYPTYFFNITGISGYFNFLNPQYPSNPYGTFLNMPETRVALHVGNLPCMLLLSAS